MSDEIASYGWTAVPRDRSNVPSAEEAAAPQTNAAAVDITGIWPDNELMKKAREYAKRELPTETYNHSFRVYAYGKPLHLISSGFRKKGITPFSPHTNNSESPLNTPAPIQTETDTHRKLGHQIVTQYLPDWKSSTFFETWALTCLFHDIGTTVQNMSSTHMSFDFQGGFIALAKLQEFGAPKIQAESVAEAIIRHQDPGETGTISAMGQLIQTSTLQLMFMLILLATLDTPRSQAKPPRLVSSLLSTSCSETAARSKI
ncbi:cyanamide hydratase [Alternaria alternata]|nr:cyanamide hydratase [Alternaria alternata]